MNLKRFHGKRIVLVMDVQGREVVLHGTTKIHKDRKQGSMLQVSVADEDGAAVGCPTILISEQRWLHHIASGFAYGCELLLDLSQSAVPAS